MHASCVRTACRGGSITRELFRLWCRVRRPTRARVDAHPVGINLAGFDRALNFAYHKGASARLEQAQRLADPSVIADCHPLLPLFKVLYIDVAPMFLEILRYQSTMTVMRFVLAA